MDNVVLSYKNSVLRESDILLLTMPDWLNDNILSFYYEYLENNLPDAYKDQILFVGPEVTQCLKIVSRAEMQHFLEPSVASSKSLIFFALNDHLTPDKSGGTHWSLLVYSKPDHTLFHFDSLSGSNYKVASKFAINLIPHISVTNEEDLKEVECLQQNNGYDCGIFVITHTEHAIKYFIENNSLHSIGKVRSTPISHKRQKIIQLINELKEK